MRKLRLPIMCLTIMHNVDLLMQHYSTIRTLPSFLWFRQAAPFFAVALFMFSSAHQDPRSAPTNFLPLWHLSYITLITITRVSFVLLPVRRPFQLLGRRQSFALLLIKQLFCATAGQALFLLHCPLGVFALLPVRQWFCSAAHWATALLLLFVRQFLCPTAYKATALLLLPVRQSFALLPVR